MQYLKLGPIRIPYVIAFQNKKKVIRIAGIPIAFSSYVEGTKKYYRVGCLQFRLPFLNKQLDRQRRSSYELHYRLSEKELQQLAVNNFREKMGYTPDLQSPRTMNEKILWLKLFYKNPLVTTCCDKLRVKDYVTEKLGPGYVIPTIACWERAEDVDFSRLPEKYVLKVNWSSGYNILVADRHTADEASMRERIACWMRPEQNCYYQTLNWGYKDMRPAVYAEEYIQQGNGQLYDYKIFCCSGKARFWFIATNRHGDQRLTHDFYDMDFRRLPFTYGNLAHSQQPLEKPARFEEMVRIAEKLAEPFPFVRVDFYETEDRLFVGEMTFYPGSGIYTFDPPEWDSILGDYIQLFDQQETKGEQYEFKTLECR